MYRLKCYLTPYFVEIKQKFRFKVSLENIIFGSIICNASYLVFYWNLLNSRYLNKRLWNIEINNFFQLQEKPRKVTDTRGCLWSRGVGFSERSYFGEPVEICPGSQHNTCDYSCSILNFTLSSGA